MRESSGLETRMGSGRCSIKMEVDIRDSLGVTLCGDRGECLAKAGRW